jgi:hypothetical protein
MHAEHADSSELNDENALGHEVHTDAHRMQCTNYLKATGLRLCLLLNFVWHMSYKPRRAICVLRVNRLSASALNSFLA